MFKKLFFSGIFFKIAIMKTKCQNVCTKYVMLRNQPGIYRINRKRTHYIFSSITTKLIKAKAYTLLPMKQILNFLKTKQKIHKSNTLPTNI